MRDEPLRGFAPWRPQQKTVALLGQVEAVLDEYEDYLPMTIRQVFYRLVGAYGYEKTEEAYWRLCEILVRARRAERIPFDAIRADGGVELAANGFSDRSGFWQEVEAMAASYRRDRLAGQDAAVEVWAEAAGMAPLLAAAVEEYGVAVYSGGGFDSLTWKHEAALRFARREQPTAVLHVGDFDPSGLALYIAAAEDVAAFAAAYGAPEPSFERVAVTPEQIERLQLPTAPPKRSDKRGVWQEGDQTVQAEALPPDALAEEISQAVEELLDLPALRALVAEEERERQALLTAIHNRTEEA